VNIDQALKIYVDLRPPEGMEVRILRRVHRPNWRWPALALAAAALLCLAIAIPAPKGSSIGTRRESSYKRMPAQATGPAPPVQRPATRRLHRKPDTVQALWRFAHEHPETAIQLTETHEFEPIAPLEIEPLKIEESGVAP